MEGPFNSMPYSMESKEMDILKLAQLKGVSDVFSFNSECMRKFPNKFAK